MQTIEQRVLGHAVAAGLLQDGEAMNGYAAEAAAYAADACAGALAAGADFGDVIDDLTLCMTQAGASAAEHVYVQFVVAEVRAVVHRLPDRRATRHAAAIRAAFRWTELPRAGGRPRVVIAMPDGALDDRDRNEAAEIYRVAIARAFGNLARAYRTWDAWRHAPTSRDGLAWSRPHRLAVQLAVAGLAVDEASLTVGFVFDHG